MLSDVMADIVEVYVRRCPILASILLDLRSIMSDVMCDIVRSYSQYWPIGFSLPEVPLSNHLSKHTPKHNVNQRIVLSRLPRSTRRAMLHGWAIKERASYVRASRVRASCAHASIYKLNVNVETLSLYICMQHLESRSR